jgi:phage shock protein PspC (stress-responsive transcriptional regulator)
MAEKKGIDKVKHEQAMGARRTVVEEMFNDLYRDRVAIYKMNFVRGIFFGLGSVLGATVVVALILWILSLFVDFPFIGELFKQATDTIESR